MIEQNELAPHKTVIWLKAITYEVLPSGECSGIPVMKKEEQLQVDGQDKFLCIRRTNEVLEEIKKCCKQK